MDSATDLACVSIQAHRLKTRQKARNPRSHAVWEKESSAHQRKYSLAMRTGGRGFGRGTGCPEVAPKTELLLAWPTSNRDLGTLDQDPKLFRRSVRPGAIAPHIVGEFPNLGQVALHFAPPIPHRIVVAGVECALESSHAVFQVHHEQLLFYDCGSIMEGQQVWERISIVLRFGQG